MACKGMKVFRTLHKTSYSQGFMPILVFFLMIKTQESCLKFCNTLKICSIWSNRISIHMHYATDNAIQYTVQIK